MMIIKSKLNNISNRYSTRNKDISSLLVSKYNIDVINSIKHNSDTSQSK